MTRKPITQDNNIQPCAAEQVARAAASLQQLPPQLVRELFNKTPDELAASLVANSILDPLLLPTLQAVCLGALQRPRPNWRLSVPPPPIPAVQPPET